MASLDEVSGWLAENFAALLEKYKVPGGGRGARPPARLHP
jgi:hypothetical protein